MKTITQHRQESTLNKVFRYNEGIMTRKEWLKLQISKGATVKEKTRRNYAAEDKLKDWLHNHRDMLSGNENWPPTKEWYAQKAKLDAGIYKTEYELCLKDGCFYNITKIEFDYVNNYLLAELINTEKNDLNNRIEAGIATENEINEAMQAEYEFFNKYTR